MRIYVIRHSHPSEDPSEADEDPGLDGEGEEIAEALAKWMVEHDEVPTILYASPMTRTQETAERIAKALGEAGLVKPEIVTDASIGPHMSIKGLVEQLAKDETATKVGIVSHHESIEHGMRVLGREPWVHLDMLAQGEMRALKIKRKDGDWKEKFRVQPSDLGLYDNY